MALTTKKVSGFRLGIVLPLLVICHVLRSSYAWAETVRYYDVDLPVDEVLSASGGYNKISIGPESFLVSEADSGRRVALRLLQDQHAGHRLSFDSFQRIISQALLVSDAEVVRAALSLGLRIEAFDALDERDPWKTWASSPVGKTVLREEARFDNPQALPRRLCVIASVLGEVPGAADSVDVESAARAWADSCLNNEIARVERTTFPEGEFSKYADDLDAARAIFTIASNSIQMKARRMSTVLRRLSDALTSLNGELFAVSSKELVDALTGSERRKVRELRLEEVFIKAASAKGRYAVVLEFLPRLSMDRRTPNIHEHVLKALRSEDSSSDRALETPEISAVLREFALKDDEIQTEYDGAIRRVVSKLVTEGNRDTARAIITDSMAGKEAPPASLESSVIEVIRAYLDAGEFSNAVDTARVWLPNPPVTLKAALLCARYGLPVTSLWLVALLVVVGGGVLTRLRRNSATKRRVQLFSKPPKDATKASRVAEAAGDVSPTDFFSNGYEKSLEVFGLKPGVDLAEIKNAYRRAVKRVHPDLRPDAGPDEQAEFIKLTQEYERLLELHEQQFPSRSSNES